ncbi:MAG: hypothetical protein P0Y56_03525 [Candidatus Andeanibacterium colombiense]|uniref:Uncharacterized protein n=1 Tax=Candidatus Andeanibacterium colombiense TaxID=3121345 RepID=A0AAJ5X6J0_9SPHN|nr:MAG: hypothetical protein P0Y56_03525 [Sphingomonadaceae bacterium]
MSKAVLLALPALLSLAGCGARDAYLWTGYRAPAAGSFRATSADGTCPAIGIQNLTPRDAETIVAAAREVCGIFHSEEFARAAAAKTDWLASCDGAFGRPQTVTGAELVALLRRPKPAVSVIARKPVAAIAKVEPANGRLAIRQQWFSYWPDGTIDQRANLVATVAHEFTHLSSLRFLDSGMSKACGRDRLASYAVGELAGEVWLEQQRTRVAQR